MKGIISLKSFDDYLQEIQQINIFLININGISVKNDVRKGDEREDPDRIGLIYVST